MSTELSVIIPSRNRPQAVQQLAESFAATCSAWTSLILVVDEDDADVSFYKDAVEAAKSTFAAIELLVQDEGGNMITGCNVGASRALDTTRDALAFMGDDHRPRTRGWDRAYLDALKLRPGIVYGNDLLQGEYLPTQFAVSARIVENLGFLAPPTLIHLYMDDYWLRMGRLCECITYLADVVVEHMHPAAGKADTDAGYERVNAHEINRGDRAALNAHMDAFVDRDMEAIYTACESVSGSAYRRPEEIQPRAFLTPPEPLPEVVETLPPAAASIPAQEPYTFFWILCPPGGWTEVVAPAPMDRLVRLNTNNPCPRFTFSEKSVFDGSDTARPTVRTAPDGDRVRSDVFILPAGKGLYGQSASDSVAETLAEGYVTKPMAGCCG